MREFKSKTKKNEVCKGWGRFLFSYPYFMI
jgi:hypothetical protein